MSDRVVEYINFTETDTGPIIPENERANLQDLNRDLEIVYNYMNLKAHARMKSAIESGKLPGDNSAQSENARIAYKDEQEWAVLVDQQPWFKRTTYGMSSCHAPMGDNVTAQLAVIQEKIPELRYNKHYDLMLNEFLHQQVARAMKAWDYSPMMFAMKISMFTYQGPGRQISAAIAYPEVDFNPLRSTGKISVTLWNRVYTLDREMFAARGKSRLLKEIENMTESARPPPIVDIDV